MRCPLTILTLLSLILNWCSSHSILAFLPLPIWSHFSQVEPIFHALAERGHSVTVMSPFSPKKETPNYRYVKLSAEDAWKQFVGDWNPTKELDFNPALMIPFWKAGADLLVRDVFNSSAFRDLVGSGSEFDLIFTELFFCQESFVILGQIFNAPVVSYSSFGHSPQILQLVGAANAFAYLPDKDFEYAGPMTILQRLNNAFLYSATMLHRELWFYPEHDKLISKYFPGSHPTISEMLRNVSLFFFTENIAVDGAKLYPPNVVQLSGLNIKEPAPLDKELQSVMDGAKNGVIYFSYGSIIQMSHFKKEALETYMAVFRQLDYTVLWKSELNGTDLEIPGNVHVRKWFDQTSVLAHPKCVLFLTHGGLSSMTEAIRHAVPVIGTPFYGDQKMSVAQAEYMGRGLRLPYKSLTQQTLLRAIQTVLGDPRFKENMRKASKILSDKPISSLDTAIYWIEYVIRHKGAHHLKPLAAQIPWYQLFLLDVFAIFSITFLVITYIMSKLVLLLWRALLGNSKLPKAKNN